MGRKLLVWKVRILLFAAAAVLGATAHERAHEDRSVVTNPDAERVALPCLPVHAGHGRSCAAILDPDRPLTANPITQTVVVSK
jgi:hypothetical protein